MEKRGRGVDCWGNVYKRTENKAKAKAAVQAKANFKVKARAKKNYNSHFPILWHLE